MLNKDTKQLVADYFIRVASAEKQIEGLRLALCQSPYFELHSLFNELSQSSAEITYSNLMRFVEFMGLEVTGDFVWKLILQYDSNSDGKLSFQDFCGIVIPYTDSQLKDHLAQTAYTQPFPKALNLFSEVLQAEIKTLKIIEEGKQRLSSNPNFSLVGAFSSLSSKEGINERSIQQFFHSLGMQVPHSDILAIFKRFDKNSDNVITYTEFLSCLCAQKSFSKYKNNPSDNHTEELYRKLINFFQLIIGLQSNLERIREDLAICPDFTLLDSFKLFDINNQGFLTLRDFQNILYELQVPLAYNCDKLFEHFHQGGKLNQQSFTQMLSPKNSEYLQLIKNRIPAKRVQPFSYETLSKLIKFIEVYISSEMQIASAKCLTAKEAEFAFKTLSNQQVLSSEKLWKLLSDYGTRCPPEDLDLLYQRLAPDFVSQTSVI